MILVGNYEEKVIRQAFNNSLWSALDKYYNESKNIKYRCETDARFIKLTHCLAATDGFHYFALNP